MHLLVGFEALHMCVRLCLPSSPSFYSSLLCGIWFRIKHNLLPPQCKLITRKIIFSNSLSFFLFFFFLFFSPRFAVLSQGRSSLPRGHLVLQEEHLGGLKPTQGSRL